MDPDMECARTKGWASKALSAGALICLIGCTSPSRLVTLGPIGPGAGTQYLSSGTGYLQVYSAGKPAPFDPYMDEWLWNNDYGRNGFLYEADHSDYSIFAKTGALLERVRNARDQNNAEPTIVSLPAGVYEVQAEAADYDGPVDVRVTVVIQAGRKTVAHLAGGWRPKHHYAESEIVRLPDGEIAGWLAGR